jgi:hypothetical protein
MSDDNDDDIGRDGAKDTNADILAKLTLRVIHLLTTTTAK